MDITDLPTSAGGDVSKQNELGLPTMPTDTRTNDNSSKSRQANNIPAVSLNVAPTKKTSPLGLEILQTTPTTPDDSLGSGDSTKSSSVENRRQGFINVPLIPLKIVLVCWYGAGACLLPYMTLHMRQLGLTMVETTAVYAILPIIQLFGTPIAGFMADRTGNYRSVLLTTLGVCILTTLLIQYIVPARRPRDPNPVAPASTTPSEANDDSAAEALYMVTFWLYLVIRVFHQVAVGLTYVLLDTTTIVKAEEHNSTYGRQRLWAIFSTGVFSPICGIIIDYMSSTYDEFGQKINNYAPAFHLFNFLTGCTLFMASIIQVQVSALPTNVWGNVRPLLRSANVWAFLFSVFIMGSCWGFLESFLFIHLQKLGAPNYLLGLTVTVGAAIGVPFLYTSDWFIKKVGALQLLLVALAVYSIRLVGYSLLEDPWWCLPYELMEAFTLHLMWVATVGLAYQISPPGMLASLQAVVGGLNFGVGRGFGSLVGGSMIALYGFRVAFRVVAGMALTTVILYAVLLKTCLPPLETHDKKLNRSESLTKRRRQTAKDIEDSCPDLTTAAAS